MSKLCMALDSALFRLGLLVFVCLGHGSAAAEPPAMVRSMEIADGVEMEFRWIAPGSYLRGSPEGEAGRDRDEGPLHQVVITRGFYLGTCEVTQAQWRAVMGTNHALFRDAVRAEQLPVESVTWRECGEFLKRLAARCQRRVRLPTEAEWEYACRAGTTTRFPWGDAPEDWQSYSHAWANSRSHAMPQPVAGKPANAWGLHDMNGNVWEWCSDWYAPYAQGEQVDPQGPPQGTAKVFRGGSWFDFPKSLRSANRHRHGIDERYPAIGLRVVWDPEAPQTGSERVFLLPGGVPLEMVEIPAGSFTMGSDAEEAGRQNDEGPPHRVAIGRPFYLGKYEVTQAQWQAVMGQNPSVFAHVEGAEHWPVDHVSWDDAQELIERLNAAHPGRFRLPTEAEWEYACRGNTSERFPWGADLRHSSLPDYAWFNPWSEGRSHAVGGKRPNTWGLYDMHGNVWEWCADWADDYPAGEVVDPRGPATGQRKVIRGGSWFNEPEALRPANRHAHPRDSRGPNLGLRLVWTNESEEISDAQ